MLMTRSERLGKSRLLRCMFSLWNYGTGPLTGVRMLGPHASACCTNLFCPCGCSLARTLGLLPASPLLSLASVPQVLIVCCLTLLSVLTRFSKLVSHAPQLGRTRLSLQSCSSFVCEVFGC
jgi:hypothetical protein